MNIFALSTVVSGIDTLRMLGDRLEIKGIIGLANGPSNDAISGFASMESVLGFRNIDFIPVQSYGLEAAEDKKRLMDLEIDVLLVLGWQRLIPEWLLEHCRICAIGAHGSPYGITQGRGRSPQNWALLLGEKKFYLSIFCLDKGIDSGPVIATKQFPLTEEDDIRTSYYKANWVTAQMIIENFENGHIASRKWKCQSGAAKYLPKRLPEDGAIDWKRTTADLLNFIRALTRPYPGAYSQLGDYQVKIWKAVRCDVDSGDRSPEGKIITIFHNGEFLVKTKDGLLLVEDYSICPKSPGEKSSFIQKGFILLSSDFQAQMENIIKRHYAKYPELEISEKILRLAR